MIMMTFVQVVPPPVPPPPPPGLPIDKGLYFLILLAVIYGIVLVLNRLKNKKISYD